MERREKRKEKKRKEKKRKEKKEEEERVEGSKDTFLSTSLMMTIEEIHLEADATLMPLVIESVLPCFLKKIVSGWRCVGVVLARR